MSKTSTPVMVLHLLELATPETLGQKVREFLLKNHKSSTFWIMIPERDPQPMTSGPDNEI